MQRIFIITFLLLLILGIRFYLFYQSQENYSDGQEIEIQARLADEPEIKNGKQNFRIKGENNQGIYVTTGLEPQLKYGDSVNISGKLREKTYDDYMLFTMNFPEVQIRKNDQNFITRLATAIRRKADNIYQKSLPSASAGLLSGIVLGGSRSLPDKLLDDLQVSGVTHVIAASGMNVTFVASFLMGFFGMFLRRQIAITIAILGIFFYAFIAGFEPSIVRASIMGSIVFSARLMGKQSFALLSLLLTALAMLIYNPSFIEDVGFQLSVTATAGIVLIKPVLDKGFDRLGKLGKFGKEDVATTVAAQIATLPILLGTFGTFNLLSVLVNALVLWTIPVLMVIGGLGLIAGIILEPLGRLILLFAAPILFYFEKTVGFFGKIDWTISIDTLSVSAGFGYYLILASYIIFTRQKTKIEAKN